jgi:hypothetical protein
MRFRGWISPQTLKEVLMTPKAHHDEEDDVIQPPPPLGPTDEEKEEWEKKRREAERSAAVAHGSILDEDMAEALDKQDEKEKEQKEKEAELVKQGHDVRLAQQAGQAKDKHKGKEKDE